VDPLTIAACVSGATRAYNMVAKCVNAGRELQDTAQFLGQFFDSKEKILELEIENQKGPKLLRGKSIEAQALEIQMAKHKTGEMEKQLRELCYYTVGKEFYEEMMVTRRKIRDHRLRSARERAERQRLLIDGGLVAVLFAALVALLVWMATLLTNR
jgi:hypothetical protein